MNIDNALPKSPPDVSVVEEVVAKNTFASVVAQGELHSGTSSTTVQDANVLDDKFDIPLNSTPIACSISKESVELKSAEHGLLSANVPEISKTIVGLPIRCAVSHYQTPHLPHEDAEYQQRICGTPELRNHLLTHQSASQNSLQPSDDQHKSAPASANASNQSSASSIDCTFGGKRSAVFGSEARRTANKSRLLDRSETGAGGLGSRKMSARRVSFPDNDSELVTGYLEPANPWATVKPIASIAELAELYRESCAKHRSRPIEAILQHLNSLEEVTSEVRRPLLSLREHRLSAASCEALEEVLKRLQYKLIDLTACDLDDVSATALFEMIEYYEAANEIDISENRNITTRGWHSCINMIKRSHALQMLSTRGTPLSETNAINMGKALLGSSLHTLKLEHCGLSGRPMASLCNYLRKNTVLKELWLAHNDLNSADAFNVGIVLKANYHLQFLDVSNNKIEDVGLLHITEALLEQAHYFRRIQEEAAILAASASLNSSVNPDHPITDLVLNTPSQSSLLSSSTDDEDVITDLPQIDSNPPKRSMLETLLQSHKQQDAMQKDNNHSVSVEATTIQPDELQTCVDNQLNNNNLLPNAASRAINENPTTQFEPTETAPTADQSTSFDLNENNSATKTNPNCDVVTTTADIFDSPSVVKDLIVFEEDTARCPTDVTTDGDDDNKPNDLVNQVQIECSNNRINNKLDEAIVIALPATNPIEHPVISSPATPPRPATPAVISPHPNVIDNLNIKEAIISTIDDEVSELAEFTPTPPIPTPPLIPFTMTLPPNTTTIPSAERPSLTSENLKCHTSSNNHNPLLSKSLDSSLSTEALPSFRHANHQYSIAPERSFSLESLNSETSVDSNDSKSSIKLAEQKFSKNGTLERQQQQLNATCAPSISSPAPTGLQVLILWNNGITRESSKALSDLFASTTTLEILNVGRNVLSNDFLSNVKSSLKTNTSLTSLGLQSAHLTCAGIRTLSECLEFGGNSTLQRIDVRDNHLQVAGLTALNDVLKSNKSVMQIDMDDVPRRAHDLGADSTIDYSRMVTNIRSQCARNENPPKPEPVRTTAINKRVRANYLNSRKISLTCHSIRSIDPPCTNNAGISTSNNAQSKPSTAALKGERLLNPERKSAGRLRSPLPSPIPSPTPSPSRNRFQVSRVLESSANSSTSSTQSATTSPMTPPSSSSCSPTSFFSASHRNQPPDSKLPQQSSSVPRFSRFRVTTVVESSLPKHKSLPDHLHQSDNSTFHLPTTQSDQNQIKSTSSTSTTADTNTTKDYQQPLAASPKTTCSSTLTAPITGTPPPPTSLCPSATDELPTKSTNNHHLPHSKSQPELIMPNVNLRFTNTEIVAQQQQQHHSPTTSAPALSPHMLNVTNVESAVAARSSASPSQPLLAATSKMSTSFDSPDLEVKRFMDDSCSSISSIDSIRGDHQFMNTSTSSVDSCDLLGTPSSVRQPSLHGLAAKTHPAIPIFIDKTRCEPVVSSTSCGIKPIHDSLSSLETSTGSNDSLFEESTLPGPPPPSSSNEGTLTNSPVGPSSGFTSPSPSSEGDRDISSGLSPVKAERRVRKTSWIKGDSGYPASIDKLLSIFHHPGQFFTRQSTNTPSVSSADDTKREKDTHHHADKPPSRKESPMSGLLGWTSMSRKDHDPCPDVSCVSQSPPPHSLQTPFQPQTKLQTNTKSIKSPLQPNYSPENTITTTAMSTPTSTMTTTTTVPSSTGSPDHQAAVLVPTTTPCCPCANLIVSIPDRLQKEMKENISPEHTITSSTLMSVKSQPQPSSPTQLSTTDAQPPSQSEIDAKTDRVHFELGGDDDDEDEEEDDEENATQRNNGTTSDRPSTSSDASLHDTTDTMKGARLDVTNRIAGLGQITRDSLSILHGEGNSSNSRDSMRSLESLTEIDNNVFR